MATDELDARLCRDGVFFLPWIGDHYENGFSGHKLLILGESHYSVWDGEQHELDRTFTRECIDEVVQRIAGRPFWPNLEQVLLNEERVNGWPPNGGKALWDRLAFYNFVQTPVCGKSRVQPSPKDFEDSHKPFKTLIEELRPDRVIVCGYRLWDRMGGTPYDSGERDGTRFFRHPDVQAYRLKNGTPTWCLAVTHPSAAFSWRKWHPIIHAFLDDPVKGADLLAGIDRQQEFATYLLRRTAEELGAGWEYKIGEDPAFNKRDAWVGLHKKDWPWPLGEICVGLYAQRLDWTAVGISVSVPAKMTNLCGRVREAVGNSELKDLLSEEPNKYCPVSGMIPYEDHALSAFANWVTPEFIEAAFPQDNNKVDRKEFRALVSLLVKLAKLVGPILDEAAQVKRSR